MSRQFLWSCQDDVIGEFTAEHAMRAVGARAPPVTRVSAVHPVRVELTWTDKDRALLTGPEARYECAPPTGHRARVDYQDKTPHAVRPALDELTALRARVNVISSELAVDRDRVKRLERIVRVFTLEHEQLRRSEADGANVVTIKLGSHERHHRSSDALCG